MDRVNRRDRRLILRTAAVLIAASLVLLFLTMAAILQIRQYDRDWEEGQRLLTSTQDMLRANRENVEELTASVKEDYIVRARAAAYIVEGLPESRQNARELRKIAELLQVDELHLFDTKGTIVFGTNPEYYGYSMDSGAQMAFFKPLLTDRSLALCQDVTPNTAEGKPMMYAMVWREDGEGLVQIGQEPRRLLEAIRSSDIPAVTANMLMEPGNAILITEPDSGLVLGSASAGPTASSLGELGIFPAHTREVQRVSLRIGGCPYYCVMQLRDGYRIVVLLDAREGVEQVLRELVPMLACMILMAFAILWVIGRYSATLERERSSRLREQQRQNARLREALEKAEVASRSKTTFLFNVSHDIRTPMNAILGFAELAEKHPEQSEGYIKKIRQSGDVLLRILNDVLDLARIESGKYRLEPVPHDLRQTLELMKDLFGESMTQAGLHLCVVDRARDAHVVCDALRLQQILINLLSNAQKFTPRGGDVTLTLEQLPGGEALRYRLSVQDTGIGMSEDFLEHIFDAFERERTATVTGIQGTGLGLSIVKNLVEMMNGTIRVDSTPGRGSRFDVELEFPPAREEPAAAPETETEFGFLAGRRLLVVEDNELNQEIVCALLEDCGIQAEVAGTGLQALGMLLSKAADYYDLVLMDIQMPGIDGYETTRRIRRMADPTRAGIPVVAMTANAFDEDRQNALEAGMNEHLAKPLDQKKLLQTLAKLLTDRR